ncbi:MAG: cytochrome c oxidase cbb3-type subunit 3 [Rhodothermales bacterium]|jgi:cytochrome c oxidase cbb3-type subunit 3
MPTMPFQPIIPEPMDNQTESREDVVIQGHNYDGIREYDNPMPGWWLWILWATIIWTPLYIVGVHYLDVIPTYQQDLARGQAEILEVRQAFAAANPSFDASPENLADIVADPDQIAAGAGVFAANCAACHGAAGQGQIGPNLTDAYWIHGGTNVDFFNVITDGVIEKGMAPWGSILSAEKRAQLVAFVRSLEGTDPSNAKAPQGTLTEGSEAAEALDADSAGGGA